MIIMKDYEPYIQLIKKAEETANDKERKQLEQLQEKLMKEVVNKLDSIQ